MKAPIQQKEDFIVEIGGKRFINLVKILPETLPSGKVILWRRVDDGKIKIFVDESSAPGGNPKPVTTKPLIEVNEDLFELFGFWLGDGIRKQATENTLGFSNTEIALHKEFLRVCSSVFGLSSNDFKCGIQLTSEFMDSEKEIKNKISKELEIPLENFWKTRINEKRNTVGIDIRNDSRLWGVILTSLFNLVKELSFEKQEFAAKMLQGIISSEANVHVRSDSGRLGEISIAGKEEEKRNFIRKLLLFLGIEPNKDKTIENQEAVLIHGLSNFKKMKKWNLVSLHPLKLQDFERGLKNFKKEEFRKGECKFLVLQILSNSKMKSTKELAKELNRKPRTVNDALAFLEKKNLIERIRIGRRVFWGITENGLSFLRNNKTFKELSRNN